MRKTPARKMAYDGHGIDLQNSARLAHALFSLMLTSHSLTHRSEITNVDQAKRE
jgi:hypothetical protein